ncbi:MAG TPA: GNAT family N-acetyltransferase [Streptosporangiaceae bacterium]
MEFEVSRRAGDVAAAAQIWAAATSARDGHRDVPGLDISRPIIQGVLDRSARSMLLMARSGDGEAGGFAAVQPAEGAGTVTAQVSYLGVRPGDWGRGIGEALLRELPQALAQAGFTRAELSVYVENGRATRLYERLGWRPFGEPTPHPRTGKPGQRYELSL